MEFNLKTTAEQARRASYNYALLSTASKNNALIAIAAALRKNHDRIFEVNLEDVKAAKEQKLAAALVDRLTFNESRFEEMVSGVEKVALLSDPVGQEYDGRVVSSGLRIVKRRVPFGVIGVIYESRPNVTVDIAALCLKSGNACILRGGSEVYKTNCLLHEIMQQSLKESGIDPEGIAFVADTDRELVGEFLKLDDCIDVIIPRGGEKLQRRCQRESSIPVIIGGFGISHIFADLSCNIEKAVPLIVNAKVQKPSACNALDTLIVHPKIADELLRKLLPELSKYQVTVHAEKDIFSLCKELGYEALTEITSEDMATEYLSLHMNIIAMDEVSKVLAFMRSHGAVHSDAILTDSCERATEFVNGASSACVYVNATTRFTDGGQFGLGAEVAISTQKLHARGPMALEELTTYKYICTGDYLVRK